MSSEEEAILLDFIHWYWKEIDGKPYQISSGEILVLYLIHRM